MTTPPDPGVRDPGEIASAPDNPGPPDAARMPDASGTPVAPGMADTPGTPDAGGTRDAPGASGDPVSLLVSAVGQLPPEQRDLVFTWLLRQRPALARQWTLGASVLEADELQSLQRAAGRPLRGFAASAQQVVPVRFPAEQHAQLREWCAEHGFSMATVIRGLVARFLEGQLPDRS
jgi:hypothetical protein